MKKTLIISIILCISNMAIAQRVFYFGPSYTAGISTILKSGNGMGGMNGSMMQGGETVSDLTFTPAFGSGVRLEYYPVWEWGMYFQCGWQQGGARFKNYMDNYNPRYRFNQCDFNLGGQFRTKGLIKNHQFLIQLGLVQHYLAAASRVYDMGRDNITDETRGYDVGIFMGIGANIPIMEKDMFQALIFANQGLVNPFLGHFETNGVTGKNLLLGIQCSYLIGKTFEGKK